MPNNILPLSIISIIPQILQNNVTFIFHMKPFIPHRWNMVTYICLMNAIKPKFWLFLTGFPSLNQEADRQEVTCSNLSDGKPSVCDHLNFYNIVRSFIVCSVFHHSGRNPSILASECFYGIQQTSNKKTNFKSIAFYVCISYCLTLLSYPIGPLPISLVMYS